MYKKREKWAQFGCYAQMTFESATERSFSSVRKPRKIVKQIFLDLHRKFQPSVSFQKTKFADF
ncbi:CLUMA_CG007795, isoform A [Clunio marinus]|uniref:CLUMA_CG007795, isoform A n=1 Tax=Clunio marinus TaxID=568069 RepID=A0A1J1I1S8_9DIPT|nr:CLUMA_CG007795, isoform A [Clunio marinus]